MIIAYAGDDDNRLLILGVDRENIRRLTSGDPLRVSESSHPGVPLDGLTIVVLYGNTIADIQAQLQPFIDANTKVMDWRGLQKDKKQ